jgi:hypothetical protein
MIERRESRSPILCEGASVPVGLLGEGNPFISLLATVSFTEGNHDQGSSRYIKGISP